MARAVTKAEWTEPKHFGKREIIKVIDGVERVYLRRWYIFRCRRFCIMLHHILMPDLDRDYHDHPWAFVSFVLAGSYTERWMRPPELALRRLRYVHHYSRHRLGDAHKITEIHRMRGEGIWTLVITGRERKEWGFYTPEGWLDHGSYGVTPYRNDTHAR